MNNENLVRIWQMSKSQKHRNIAISGILKNNSGLIIKTIKRTGCDDYEDFIQYASPAIMKAMDKFDFSRNIKFSSFLVWQVLGEVSPYLRQVPTIKPPSRLKGKMPIQSLNDPISDTNDSEMINTIRGESEEYSDTYKYAKAILTLLETKQKYIITKSFGLDGNEPMNNMQIGQHINLTRERVRQIKDASLRKISKIVSQKAYLGNPVFKEIRQFYLQKVPLF